MDAKPRTLATNGVRVALYPHTGFWVERVDDGTRLARAVDRPNLGTTFNLCHWLKVDGQDLEKRLEEAGKHLFVVTINGADAARFLGFIRECIEEPGILLIHA